jgi:type I restriction-modification system DNA methylase subunit
MLDLFAELTEVDAPRKPEPPPKQKAVVRSTIPQLVEQVARYHSKWEVFSDFLEMAACAVSNSVDRAQYDLREACYMRIVKKYDKEEMNLICQMLGELTLKLEEGHDDVLGNAFHALELHNKWHGQFFTPYCVSKMMAQMSLAPADGFKAQIEKRGYVTVCEPCVGAGAMLIAFAEAALEEGINPQRQIHMTGIDIDLKCVHMAYLQLSLLGIPAVLVHGNSLGVEQWSTWYTPAHVLGGWSWRLEKDRPAVPEPKPTPVVKPQEVRQVALWEEVA